MKLGKHKDEAIDLDALKEKMANMPLVIASDDTDEITIPKADYLKLLKTQCDYEFMVKLINAYKNDTFTIGSVLSKIYVPARFAKAMKEEVEEDE